VILIRGHCGIISEERQAEEQRKVIKERNKKGKGRFERGRGGRMVGSNNKGECVATSHTSLL